MIAYNVLILTDHRQHSAENSVYALATAIYRHPKCVLVDIASAGTNENLAFFNGAAESRIAVVHMHSDLLHSGAIDRFNAPDSYAHVHDYDFVILRLPPPLSRDFTDALVRIFDEHYIVNRPSGIFTAGSKEFLLNFPELCPPMAYIDGVEDLLTFAQKFPIVLKPLRSYSGKGILKIQDGTVESDEWQVSLEVFCDQWNGETPYLGMQYLKRVTEGDKRVVVCNGQILGASLRLPGPGDWRCNVGQGGSSSIAEVMPEEREISKKLWPRLKELGIVMFGFDTLVSDNGKRVLSEINTTSIGGLIQMEVQQGRPILARTAELIVQHFDESTDGL